MRIESSISRRFWGGSSGVSLLGIVVICEVETTKAGDIFISSSELLEETEWEPEVMIAWRSSRMEASICDTITRLDFFLVRLRFLSQTPIRQTTNKRKTIAPTMIAIRALCGRTEACDVVVIGIAVADGTGAVPKLSKHSDVQLRALTALYVSGSMAVSFMTHAEVALQVPSSTISEKRVCDRAVMPQRHCATTNLARSVKEMTNMNVVIVRKGFIVGNQLISASINKWRVRRRRYKDILMSSLIRSKVSQ